MNFSNHPHWPDVVSVCDTLMGAGHQAWLAGGCVRDALLGETPHDFDIATDASPEQVEKLFSRSVAVGKQFGVIVIPFDGFNVEVATFRKDGLYVDGRRPEQVTYSSPREDAERRDFTVNALFYDLKNQRVVDYVGGENDLKAHVIRTVGLAKDRFTEDKLRLLRAVRFAAQLDFEVEPTTLAAVTELAPAISVVSAERIRDELMKLLKAQTAEKGLHLLERTGLLREILPELTELALAKPEEWARAKVLVPQVRTPEARLWILLWPVIADAEGILRRLKFSNAEIRAATEALRSFKLLPNASLAQKRRILAQSTGPIINEVCRAAAWFTGTRNILEGIRPADQPWVTGQDALDLGAEQGPAMGHLLEEVFDQQLDGRLTNRQAALDYLRLKIVKHK